MSCDHVQERVSPFLDGQVPAEEREKVLAHLESCRPCSAHLEAVQNLRTLLRGMDRARVPEGLVAQLRVIASHERERWMLRSSWSARFRNWLDLARLRFDNLMRPVALPLGGGALSAMLLFSILFPTLSFPHNFNGGPVFSTDPYGYMLTNPWGQAGAIGDIPKVEPVDSVNAEDSNVVELTIDEKGRVADYSLVRGELTPDLQSIILFSQFEPATVLGLRTSGKVKVVQPPLPSIIVRS